MWVRVKSVKNLPPSPPAPISTHVGKNDFDKRPIKKVEVLWMKGIR